jgi:hypothetical protein
MAKRKTAVVTGASAGVGRATAIALADRLVGLTPPVPAARLISFSNKPPTKFTGPRTVGARFIRKWNVKGAGSSTGPEPATAHLWLRLASQGND